VAGTSWDKLGQMDAAFEVVAPAIRRVAQSEGVKLIEFNRDDPIWRLNFAREAGGEAVVDVAWQEDRPDTYAVSAIWWVDDYDSAMRRLHREEIGEFTRERQLADLESMLADAIRRIDSWTEVDLDQQSGPYPDWQRYSSREEFYRTRLPRR
jgi:hypothetical protein